MENVPKIVALRLARQTKKTSDHPDPNLLSAFVEQSLGAQERGQVLEHLAICLDCRETVALSTPENVAVAVAIQPVRPWFSWPVLRWGTAIACVVVVGTAVTLYQREKRETALSSRSSESAMPESRNGRPTTSMENLAKPSPSTPARLTEPSETQAKTKALQDEIASSNAPSAQPGSSGEFALADKAEKKVSAQTSDLSVGNRLDSMVPGRAKDALDANPAPASEAAAPSALSKATGMPLNPAFAVPANRTPRWTLTGGVLERSLDSGRSWESIPVASEVQFRTLAANGLDIWVGGVNGALYHSGDAGQHWTQVQPSWNGHTLTADIIGMEFTDLQHGRVSTSAGEIWTTEDAGVTWVQH